MAGRHRWFVMLSATKDLGIDGEILRCAQNDKKRTLHDKQEVAILEKIQRKRYCTATSYLLYLLIMGTLISFIHHAQVLGSEWGPWDKDKAYLKEEENPLKTAREKNLLRSIAVFPGMMLISFFQTVISPVDGATCDFYPTCSAYARQALKKHGLIIGLTMASERICRYHSPDGYETIIKYGSYYIYDPVENNDFWFTRSTTRLP